MDLGHPPFGHDGEKIICQRVDAGDREGFEGNAQSFRIVARLAAHTDNNLSSGGENGPSGNAGLNLTRATLDAVLKYPWFRFDSEQHYRKWGAYRVDRDRFMWVRSGKGNHRLSLEAELMNWSDDVTYAVHDFEDFYRAGLTPIHRLLRRAEQDRFIAAAIKRKDSLAQAEESLEKALRAILGPMDPRRAVRWGSEAADLGRCCYLLSHLPVHFGGSDTGL